MWYHLNMFPTKIGAQASLTSRRLSNITFTRRRSRARLDRTAPRLLAPVYALSICKLHLTTLTTCKHWSSSSGRYHMAQSGTAMQNLATYAPLLKRLNAKEAVRYVA